MQNENENVLQKWLYMSNMFKQKLWQNDHLNVIFLKCINTHSQDTYDCIFIQWPAMNVAKFKVHIENAFRADHVSAPSRPVNHCVNKAGLTEGQRLKWENMDKTVGPCTFWSFRFMASIFHSHFWAELKRCFHLIGRIAPLSARSFYSFRQNKSQCKWSTVMSETTAHC